MRREVNAVRRLLYPNIVAVYDFVEDGAYGAVIMELVDGEDLDPGLIVEGAADAAHPVNGAVGPFGAVQDVGVDPIARRTFNRAFDVLPIVGVNEIEERAKGAAEVPGGHAMQLFQRRGPVGDPRPAIHLPGADALRRVEREPASLLRFGQRAFSGDALVDLAERHNRAGDRDQRKRAERDQRKHHLRPPSASTSSSLSDTETIKGGLAVV